MNMLDLIQWPAMVLTVVAAWLVASQSKPRREAGFWVFLASNGLWAVWGWHTQAYALMVLQAGLVLMNFRGVFKNGTPPAKAATPALHVVKLVAKKRRPATTQPAAAHKGR